MKNAITLPTKIKSLTRSLLRLFTEPGVQPVHTQNQNNTDDDEFAHKDWPNHERTLTTVLVKLLRKTVKKTLTADANVGPVTQDGPIPRPRRFAETWNAQRFAPLGQMGDLQRQ